MAGRSLNRYRTVTKKGGPVDPLRFCPTRKSLFGSAGLVAMTVFIEITGLVTGMIVMLARLFGDCLVAMTVLIEVSGLVPGMFVMSTGFFLGHVRLPLAGSLGER